MVFDPAAALLGEKTKLAAAGTSVTAPKALN
jgi:hypothetical protein